MKLLPAEGDTSAFCYLRKHRRSCSALCCSIDVFFCFWICHLWVRQYSQVSPHTQTTETDERWWGDAWPALCTSATGFHGEQKARHCSKGLYVIVICYILCLLFVYPPVFGWRLMDVFKSTYAALICRHFRIFDVRGETWRFPSRPHQKEMWGCRSNSLFCF